MESAEQTAPTPTEPAIVQETQSKEKNTLTLIQEWPLSRKIATAAVLLLTVVLFGALIFQARTADQQLLYANLSTNVQDVFAECIRVVCEKNGENVLENG